IDLVDLLDARVEVLLYSTVSNGRDGGLPNLVLEPDTTTAVDSDRIVGTVSRLADTRNGILLVRDGYGRPLRLGSLDGGQRRGRPGCGVALEEWLPSPRCGPLWGTVGSRATGPVL